MKTYKVPDSSALSGFSLHCVEQGFCYLLPEGYIEIDEEEEEAIKLANTAPVDPKIQIAAIERETLMNRASREALLLLIEKEAMREFGVDQATAAAGLYAGNQAYKRVKDLDLQISALRAQL